MILNFTANYNRSLIIILVSQVKKRDVDSFSIGKGIPYCMLRARALNIEGLSDLETRINLVGASEDRNYFDVHILALGEY